MLVCENCHVKIRGRKAVCPLCEGVLTGTPEDPAFPVLPKRRYTSRTVLKIALFLLCALIIVMGTLRYLLGPTAVWTTAVILWAPLGLVGLIITMAYRYNALRLISAEAYIAMVLNLLIDAATGHHGWASAYVVPSLLLGLVIALIITAQVLKMKLREYLIYLITAEFVSFFQVIFIINGVNHHPWFAVIVIAVMLILILAELIFWFQEFRTATAKTLHM